MTKLEKVRKALEANPNIVIARVNDHYVFGGPLVDGFDQNVWFSVAPKKGTLCTAEELQEAMMSLVPDVKVSMVRNCYETEYSSELWFGDLFFYEEIGLRRIETVITDEELLSRHGENGLVKEEKMQRRISIRLYPNIMVALNDNCGQYIKKSELPIMDRLWSNVKVLFANCHVE